MISAITILSLTFNLPLVAYHINVDSSIQSESSIIDDKAREHIIKDFQNALDKDMKEHEQIMLEKMSEELHQNIDETGKIMLDSIEDELMKQTNTE